MDAPVDIVEALIDYEYFESAWDKAYYELNKPSGS